VSAALDAARAALRDEDAWVVGGAVRDRLMGRAAGDDVDIVVAGDVRAAARHLALQAGGPAFPLSDDFGAWRVIGPRRAWQVDLTPLREERIEADLALRDFTVNAIAEPLGGGALIDPFDGAGDVAARRLRMVRAEAFSEDPLRVLRLARFASELGLTPDPGTLEAGAARADALAQVAAERVFAELRRVLAADDVLGGLELMDRLGATQVVLPELHALRGVGQNRFHHLDVHDHTLAVVQAVVDLQADPEPVVGPEHAQAVAGLLAEPFGDELTRGVALRVGALLHDIAKPQTRRVADDGTVLGFPGHDTVGARMAREILTRLRTSERLRAYAAALATHHLRAGFLVHQRPLTRRAVFDYLEACGPVAVDVTLLSLADRIATRGDNAHAAIAAHLEVGRELLGAALDAERDGPPAPLVRGDELAAALGIAPGPQLGALLREIAAARYAGEVATAAEAVELARRQLGSDGR
jgi:putative nucleotidyltransferase with HDIG domain